MKKQMVTRKDYTDMLFEIINPLKKYYSEEGAELNLGHTSAHYEDESIPMEGFARILWGLVPYWSGNGNDKEFKEIYLKGIISGTDKNSNEYWGDFRDLDQKYVEMAAFAYGILLAPDVVWNPLSEEEKDNFANWLYEINNYKCSESNWQFFCILTNIALKKVNRKYSKEMLEKCLERIDTYYVGGGWYVDGLKGAQDYYISFAFHVYGLLYSEYMKDEDPARCEKFKERALLFGKDFIYWFSKNGAAIPYGRSLTYRFAQVSFFSMCVLTKTEPVPLPVMKGIISRHLQYWANENMYDNDGVLSIGYAYPNLIMSEGYNAPGSPYWALKAFALLGLDENDDFWKIEPEELPKLDKIKMFDKGNSIIQHIDDNAVLFVPGMKTEHHQPNYEEKYSKFAYSSKYGFSVSRSQRTLEECAPDSVLAFEVFNHVFVRAKILESYIEPNKITTKWSPIDGIVVESIIEIHNKGHKRCHIVESEFDCVAYDCGFAIPINIKKSMEIINKDNMAMVKSNKGYCQVESIEGNGIGVAFASSPNTNLISSKTAIPSIKYDIKKGSNVIITEVSY